MRRRACSARSASAAATRRIVAGAVESCDQSELRSNRRGLASPGAWTMDQRAGLGELPALDGEGEAGGPALPDEAMALPGHRLAQAEQVGERRSDVEQGRDSVAAPRGETGMAAGDDDRHPDRLAIEADPAGRDVMLAEVEAMVADDDEQGIARTRARPEGSRRTPGRRRPYSGWWRGSALPARLSAMLEAGSGGLNGVWLLTETTLARNGRPDRPSARIRAAAARKTGRSRPRASGKRQSRSYQRLSHIVLLSQSVSPALNISAR